VVTGPVGGGKSSLCGFLSDRGAAIVSADVLGHEILARSDIISAIGHSFGTEVIVSGEVDRSALGKIVFGNRVELDRLNRITHGPLSLLAAKRLDELEKTGGHPLAVLEAAVYFALPPVPGIELVITVTASVQTRLGRLVDRKDLTPDQALARIEAQDSLQEGWDKADVVLINEGPRSHLEAAAAELWARLGH
jgi:dephospho-CoA kinase